MKKVKEFLEMIDDIIFGSIPKLIALLVIILLILLILTIFFDDDEEKRSLPTCTELQLEERKEFMKNCVLKWYNSAEHCIRKSDAVFGCTPTSVQIDSIALMDECNRCKEQEAKNWQDSAQKKTDYLIECLKSTESACKLHTCGPYNWTCKEAVIRTAHAERAYNECEHGGYFPGYTQLDAWLDMQELPE